MREPPRAPTCTRFAAAVACALALGAPAPRYPGAPAAPVAAAEFPAGDEGGEPDTEPQSVAQTRHVRPAPGNGVAGPAPPYPVARGRRGPALVVHRPAPLDRSPASLPLRC